MVGLKLQKADFNISIYLTAHQQSAYLLMWENRVYYFDFPIKGYLKFIDK